MVYSNNFVGVIKVNGQVLREIDNVVTLPFNSEYIILLKNLDAKTAVINITIDGQDIQDGSGLVLYGNTEVELQGFLKGNSVKNKFKFIEKTEEISNHRGDRIDDGIVRIEYKFEKPLPRFFGNYYQYIPVYPFDNTVWKKYSFDSTVGLSTMSVQCCAENDNGITVKGSDDVDQHFNYTTLRTLEENSNVIIIKLKGTKNSKPITVKDKITCETCGRTSKYGVKYCHNCGTFIG
uniref:Zinc-ribbon domain-containing protein n=1 Tax=viral metagenome TaxID=1070528 RepID=A0A6M3KHM7_9ZZZZ